LLLLFLSRGGRRAAFITFSECMEEGEAVPTVTDFSIFGDLPVPVPFPSGPPVVPANLLGGHSLSFSPPLSPPFSLGGHSRATFVVVDDGAEEARTRGEVGEREGGSCPEKPSEWSEAAVAARTSGFGADLGDLEEEDEAAGGTEGRGFIARDD
jgi:hypothetical protein